MENPSTQIARIEPGPLTAEVSAYTGAGTAYTVSTSSPKSNWIKSAVQLSRHNRRGEFSAYQLGEAKKKYVPPVWLTKPDPVPPVRLLRHRRGPNPHILAAKAWYGNWRNRDWDAANDFHRATNIENDPTHPIIRLG